MAAEARCLYAMLREEVRADENYWDVVSVARAENVVVINIHFVQVSA